MPPPNTPEEGELAPSNDTPTPTSNTALPLRPLVGASSTSNSNGGSPPTTPASSATVVDLRLLDYQDPIDENLICPICRVALVQPVITRCDHVFCQRCLAQAHALSPVCPIDRSALDDLTADNVRSAPKIVHNQLDNLTVKCPNRSRGCALVVARSLVENHVSRYCDKTMVPCPHPGCAHAVVRRDAGKGCLHYDVECEYCKGTMLKADLEDHQDSQCPNREKECELCGSPFLRNKQEEHSKECPEMETDCQYAPFGCVQKTARKFLDDHAGQCEYRVVGPVGEQIAELRAEVGALHEKDRLKDRRIKFLENKYFTMPAASASPEAMTDISLPESSSTTAAATATSTDMAPYESRDQYFLSLFETMESKVERLSSALQEVEGRHSMMLINETLQIKDQLTEIRSTLGVLGMHVRWLMNFRLQELGKVAVELGGVTGEADTEWEAEDGAVGQLGLVDIDLEQWASVRERMPLIRRT
ncbi:hypothetical protein G7054_g6523 [Neopestalotiopsis clavispora]|nr:hypothetical protein G7054_g6523 [Neopestalotiopsis clavispora]